MKLGDSNNPAFLYSGFSSILWVDDYRNAWDKCQEGLRRLEAAPESPGLADLLAETGRAAHFPARPTDEVIAFCQRAIEMAKRQGEPAARAVALMTIALRTRILTRLSTSCKKHLISARLTGCGTLQLEHMSTLGQYLLKILRMSKRYISITCELWTFIYLPVILRGCFFS